MDYNDETRSLEWLSAIVPDCDYRRDETYREISEAIGEDIPPSIGQDERRMQLRAYNQWARALDNNRFPRVETIDPARDKEFGPYSVLLDFAGGSDNPRVSHLGMALAAECDGFGSRAISQLSDVPPHSLLARVTDRYNQILENRTPIGFEAEFVNRQQRKILYRGILLPFSRDGQEIDHVLGVLNWKELAEDDVLRSLRDELAQALSTSAKDSGDTANGGEAVVRNLAKGELIDLMTDRPASVSIDGVNRSNPNHAFWQGRGDITDRTCSWRAAPDDDG